MAYADEVEVIEAWYEFIFGEGYEGAIRAMESLQIFPQNIMVADTGGNIYYQRTGRVPMRPEGYDWSRPVDGSTSKTDWLGFHPASHHLQVLNPPQGYMQNCNIPPDMMMRDSPFSPEHAPSYLYSDRSHGELTGWTNQRGARAVEILENDPSLSAREARDLILDLHPYGALRWIQALVEADALFGAHLHLNKDYQPGLKALKAWDGRLALDSSAALKYVYWREELAANLDPERLKALKSRIDHYRAALGEPVHAIQLGEADKRDLALSFASAMTRLKVERGSLDAIYGDVFRVGRGDRSWPVGGGGDPSLGLTTLRNIRYGEERGDGTRWGNRGQTSTQVVVLSQPIQSWTAVPIGQSDREDSSHFADQAEHLLSPGELKPTWWLPRQLAEHIASREILKDAP
jgi:acyl-homoserine lactone acylase PvdQ